MYIGCMDVCCYYYTMSNNPRIFIIGCVYYVRRANRYVYHMGYHEMNTEGDIVTGQYMSVVKETNDVKDVLFRVVDKILETIDKKQPIRIYSIDPYVRQVITKLLPIWSKKHWKLSDGDDVFNVPLLKRIHDQLQDRVITVENIRNDSPETIHTDYEHLIDKLDEQFHLSIRMTEETRQELNRELASLTLLLHNNEDEHAKLKAHIDRITELL